MSNNTQFVQCYGRIMYSCFCKTETLYTDERGSVHISFSCQRFYLSIVITVVYLKYAETCSIRHLHLK